MTDKPTVGLYSFTGCEGCSLMILECEDQLLDLLNVVEIVNFREGMDKLADEVDVAFIDGAISTNANIEEVKEIRANAKIVVALGACAWPGGLNVMKNLLDQEDVRRYVYGDKWQTYDAIPARPIDAVVKTDYYVRGCPIDRDEFLEVTKAILMGRRPNVPNHPVCVECKLNDNPCRFDFGEVCLGPIARAGCSAICPSYGSKCEGCRGMVDEPETQAHRDVLEKHGVSVDAMMREYRLFGGWFWGGDLGVPKLEESAAR